jgi:ABC-2 type transport system ATP-binding protein
LALAKSYGPAVALRDVGFEVPVGAVTGLLGPNGAGKSTLLRILAGLVRPDAGRVEVLGTTLPLGVGTQRRLGGMVEGPALYEGLTAMDNLRVAGALRGGVSQPAMAAALERVGLDRHARVRVATFSLGMKQRLGLALALLGDPELILLDEPQNGLDPDGILWLRDLLRGLAAEGRTVLLSSHALHEVEVIAFHLVVLRKGCTAFVGRTEELRGLTGPDLVVEPEHPEDLAVLLSVLDRTGVAIRRDGSSIVIRDPHRAPADFNRLAQERGITLARLERRAPSLEEVFFRLQTFQEEDP